jgi:DNA-binding XRE family transcriptional regulator
MTHPPSPIPLRPEHRVTFDGLAEEETHWTVILPDPEEGAGVAELRLPQGVRSLRFVAHAILAGVSLSTSSPELLPHLVDLVRKAAVDPAEASNISPAVVTDLLATAAQALEDQGNLESPAARSDDGHVVVPSPGHYIALQRALATRDFERVEGSAFPRASLNRGEARGYAELRPVPPQHESMMSPAEIDAMAQRMWQQREELSDQDADTLDTISALWIGRARSASERVGVYIDDLLKARGLKPKRAGNLRRGGFEHEQRTALWRCLLHLQDLWIDIAEATLVEQDKLSGKRQRKTRTLQSRAFIMTDRIGQKRLDGTMDVEAILVTPGEAFGRFLLGPGRQVALLSSKALQYDPLRQKVEKRLARYLSWQWRIAAKRAEFVRRYKVATLLQEIDLDPRGPQPPSRIRSRLEKALDQLQGDRVIAGWQYGEGWREDKLPRQGWMDIWCEAHMIVEAPEAIRTAYQNLDQLAAPSPPPPKKPKKRKEPKKKPPKQPKAAKGIYKDLAKRLKQRRLELGITQMVAAEQIRVSQGYIAQIERGRKPSEEVAKKVLRWLG